MTDETPAQDVRNALQTLINLSTTMGGNLILSHGDRAEVVARLWSAVRKLEGSPQTIAEIHGMPEVDDILDPDRAIRGPIVSPAPTTRLDDMRHLGRDA